MTYRYYVNDAGRLYMMSNERDKIMKFHKVQQGYTVYGDIDSCFHGRCTQHVDQLTHMREIAKEEAIRLHQMPVEKLSRTSPNKVI